MVMMTLPTGTGAAFPGPEAKGTAGATCLGGEAPKINLWDLEI